MTVFRKAAIHIITICLNRQILINHLVVLTYRRDFWMPLIQMPLPSQLAIFLITHCMSSGHPIVTLLPLSLAHYWLCPNCTVLASQMIKPLVALLIIHSNIMMAFFQLGTTSLYVYSQCTHCSAT